MRVAEKRTPARVGPCSVGKRAAGKECEVSESLRSETSLGENNDVRVRAAGNPFEKGMPVRRSEASVGGRGVQQTARETEEERERESTRGSGKTNRGLVSVHAVWSAAGRRRPLSFSRSDPGRVEAAAEFTLAFAFTI